MYIALYDEDLSHITNIDGVTYNLQQRVYDLDSFSATGKVTEEDIKNAKVAILNDDLGNYEYGCFVDTVSIVEGTCTIKGLDFKSLWQNEILIDYSQPNSFDARLSKIFEKVESLLFDTTDIYVNHITVNTHIGYDGSDTTALGNWQNQYMIKDGYAFLKLYLKYYGYNIESKLDIVDKVLKFDFVKNNKSIDINLLDFNYEITTTQTKTNKTIATLSFQTVKEEDGVEIITPRPSGLATSYYYLDKDNNIIQSDKYGNFQKRIYPVVAKMFEAEYLAEAQYNAVYELVNSRYNDNIIIDNTDVVDPINFKDYKLYTMINVYQDGNFYITSPITEKHITLDANGLRVKVKLGFKIIYLTEIIKKGRI